MEVFSYVITAIAAYLLGSIPTGYLVAKAKGVDIRSVGSGNIGATNVFRILGKKAGIFVLTVDALKGFLAAWLVPILIWKFFPVGNAHPNSMDSAQMDIQWLALTDGHEWRCIIAGISAILGHNYTCWLQFKGGKGIATSAGVLIALFPKAFLVCFVIWLIVFLASKFVSLASIVAAACLPFAAWFFNKSPKMLIVASLMAALAIYKHRANIQRLLNGTENRIGKKKTETPK